jgi:UDP:flavonoid glycosyltransferase YjiC (YdhE family)
MKKKKALVAALNWGLGHATRCIPVIEALMRRGLEVTVASDGASLLLLKKEFPRAAAFALPSYGMTYGKKTPMALAIGLQMPKVLLNIRQERRFVQMLHEAQHFDVVVSDCRFGCFVPGITNIYLTHQVLIRFPHYLKIFERAGAALHAMVWKKYDRVWVIDRTGDRALSGEMGHSSTHQAIRHIGILSRFADGETYDKNIDLCFLLSGPEPLRTEFERLVIGRAWPEHKKYHLIRGLPQSEEKPALPENWTVANHCSSEDLRRALLSSKMIVCRSGYSTIMDLARLGLRALLVPTPGQPEQEYLAKRMADRFGFKMLTQKEFAAKGAEMSEARSFAPYEKKDDEEMLGAAMDEVV